MEKGDALNNRSAPLEISPAEFREVGTRVVEQIANFLSALPDLPVVPAEAPAMMRKALGTGSLPELGVEARYLLEEAANLLFQYSTFNGHPRFMGMITSSAAPIGMLGDLLAAAVNANVGGWTLAPLATEMEAQTIRWIAEMIGYPTDCGGLLVSGGNMGNFVGFLAARRAKASWDVRASGMTGKGSRRLRVYTSRQVGRAGYQEMISDDMRLAQELYRIAQTHPELEAFTQALSITTFRYVPLDLAASSQNVEAYLNQLNAALLTRLQKSGEVFLSNAVIGDTFLLRACVVNFRTSLEDIEALPGIVVRLGRQVDAALRPEEFKLKERNNQ